MYLFVSKVHTYVPFGHGKHLPNETNDAPGN